MNERGVYNNPARGRQLIRFDGIRFGSITPTDIDALIEYKDKKYVFVEVKTGDKDVPQGQLLALVRLTDGVQKQGKEAITIIAEHSVENENEDIYLRDCKVRQIYYKGKWYKYQMDKPVLYTINKFIESEKGDANA